MTTGLRILGTSFIAFVFIGVHLASYKLYGFSERYKGKVLSLSGGIAISFVFLELLPVLPHAGSHLKDILSKNASLKGFLEEAAFGIAFIGFIIFFLIEYSAVKFQERKTDEARESVEHMKSVFYAHLSLTAILTMIVTYLVRFELEKSILKVVLYTVAVSFHFFVVDRSLEEFYHALYVPFGRYILATAAFLGWIWSVLFPEHEPIAYILFAFISGAILFNSIKDEVPTAGKGDPWYFFTGALSYSGLLLSLRWLK